MAAVSEAGAIGPMDDETLSDLDDGDIDQFILDKDESAVKASIWKEENMFGSERRVEGRPLTFLGFQIQKRAIKSL